jgi:hypothetical protein
MPSPMMLNDFKLIGGLPTVGEAAVICIARLDCIVTFLTCRIMFGGLISAYRPLKIAHG